MIVIFDQPIDTVDLPRVLRVSLVNRYGPNTVFGPAPSNACVVLETPAWQPREMAGLLIAMLTGWKRTPGDSIKVLLFRSPECSTIVTLGGDSTTLRGESRDWGINAEKIVPRRIFAWRLGVPTLEPCIRAAERQAGRSRRPARR